MLERETGEKRGRREKTERGQKLGFPESTYIAPEGSGHLCWL